MTYGSLFFCALHWPVLDFDAFLVLVFGLNDWRFTSRLEQKHQEGIFGYGYLKLHTSIGWNLQVGNGCSSVVYLCCTFVSSIYHLAVQGMLIRKWLLCWTFVSSIHLLGETYWWAVATKRGGPISQLSDHCLSRYNYMKALLYPIRCLTKCEIIMFAILELHIFMFMPESC